MSLLNLLTSLCGWDDDDDDDDDTFNELISVR
jgi:hypothetical protein